MLWWFLILAVAAGTVLWAALSAYFRVQERLRNAENRPARNHEPHIERPH
jgi:hypothetical protein